MTPYLQINWKKNGNSHLNFNNGFFENTEGISISYEKNCFDLKYIQNNNNVILIFGDIIFKNKINSNSIFSIIESKINNLFDLKSFCRELNGQFLIVIITKNKNELICINDRFNSIPVYYSNFQDRVIISHLYFDLFKYLRRNVEVKFNQDVILEFLWFNRVFGDDTYDNHSKFMLSAHLILFSSNYCILEKYWNPKFIKNKFNTFEAGKKLIYLIIQSVKRLTSDQKKYGIFLSGGHDSRLVISAFDKTIKSYTIGFSNNFEAKCAKKIADNLNQDNKFILLNENHFSKNLNNVTRLCGGQFSFYDAIFSGIDTKYFKEIDYIFHGHGLDYLFQGMYLPADYYKIFGSPIFFKKYSFNYKNLSDEFINRIKFRIKGFNIHTIYLKQHEKSIRKKLVNKIESLINEGEKISKDKFDLWEYLIIHTLGRHYSRPNILSKQCCAKQRTVAFDNDLFDFYLSLRPDQKLNAKVFRYAINHINKYVGKIPTGNWGFPAGDSPLIKTIKLILRKIFRLITGNNIFQAPELKDRTWPDREQLIKTDKIIKDEIKAIFSNNELKNILYKLDWEKLEQKSKDWITKKDGGASFLIALLSVHKLFLLGK